MKEVKDLIKKSEKFLNTAQLALNSGDFDSCASRCYYAMFYVSEAVLLLKGLKATSHKGVISLFGEHFIQTDTFDKSLGRILNIMYDKRLVGDYGVGFDIKKDDAKTTLMRAGIS